MVLFRRASWLILLSFVVAVAACSGDDDDDDDSDPVERAVLVQPYGAASPVAGVEVLSHDALGVIVDTAISDADGIARLEIPEGGSVASLYFDDIVLYVYELFEPPAGVTPVLRVPVAVITTPTPSPKPQPTVGPVTFDVTLTPGGGVVTSRVSIACDLDVDPETVVVLTTGSYFAYGCVGSTTDVVAFGLDGSEEPIAWGHTGGVAVSTAMPVAVSVVEDRSTFTSIAASATGLDTNLEYSFEAASVLAGYTFGRRSVSGNGAGSGTLEVAAGSPFERYVIGAQVFGVDLSDPIAAGTFYVRQVVVLEAGIPATLSVTDADLMEFEQLDLHDRRHPLIDFTTPGTGTDITTVSLDWEQTPIRLSYVAVLPPTRSDFRLGDLPDVFSPEAMELVRLQTLSESADYYAGYSDALLGVAPGDFYDRTYSGVAVDY